MLDADREAGMQGDLVPPRRPALTSRVVRVMPNGRWFTVAAIKHRVHARFGEHPAAGDVIDVLAYLVAARYVLRATRAGRNKQGRMKGTEVVYRFPGPCG